MSSSSRIDVPMIVASCASGIRPSSIAHVANVCRIVSTIAWDTRQELMRELQHVKERARIRDTFDAVGATRPVQLNQGQRTTLQIALINWSHDGMPSELEELLDRLTEEVAADE